ncbi:MAG: uracil-DNA glycosylase [Deferrisomatales bacterium]|nr:uracil-DNA glycosylase [Deferrisomatales bacterium]
MAPPKSTSPDRDTPLQATLRFAHASGAWVVPGVAPPPERAAEPDVGAPGSRLERVRDALGECTRCRLSAGRTHLVFGVGNPDADLMFVGEAPGAEEDRRGEPFVGRAGQLLDRMLQAMGLTRRDVYIANVLKCRPPGNRDPGGDEAATCTPFLWQQIDAIRPRVICALGTHAARNLLAVEGSLASLRGRVHRCRGWAVVVTYHPAYLLRTPGDKRKTWQDLQRVMGLLATST